MHIINGGMPAFTDQVLRARDAAEYLNVNIKWIYDHVESGLLPCRRLDRMVRFTLSDLNGWLSCRCHGRRDGVPHDGTQLMTVDELQVHLGVSRSWIYEARRSKRLPYFKVGGHLRFSRPMIDHWLQDRAVDATNTPDQQVCW